MNWTAFQDGETLQWNSPLFFEISHQKLYLGPVEIILSVSSKFCIKVFNWKKSPLSYIAVKKWNFFFDFSSGASCVNIHCLNCFFFLSTAPKVVNYFSFAWVIDLSYCDRLYMYFFNLCVIQALKYLGFSPTEEEQHELRQRLPVDRAGLVSYGGKSLKNKRAALFYI